MNTSFSSVGNDDVAPKPSGTAAGLFEVAADQAGRACCCPAKAVVRVIMPPTSARPHATDLLLCGHHYRVSRATQAAAHAVVHELPGMPHDTAAWIYGDHDRSRPPVTCADLPGE